MRIKNYTLTAITLLMLCTGSFTSFAGLDSLRMLYEKATQKDEQSQVLGQLAFELSKTRPDSALFLAHKGLQLGIECRSDLGIGDCLNATGWCYLTLGKDDSAVYFLDSAAHLFHSIKATTLEARCLINLSCVYNRQKHYEQALGCLLRARKMLEESTDDNAKAYAELQIGIVYRQQGQPEKALSYLKSSIANFKKAGAMSYVADALSSLGGLYIYLNDPDSSLICYRQMLAINQAAGNSYGTAFAWENMGDAYLKKAEDHKSRNLLLDSSLVCYERARRLFTDLNDGNDAVYEQFNIGKTQRRMQRYDPATMNLEAAFHFFDSTLATNNAYSATQELVLLYKELGHYEAALNYTEVGLKFKDTLDARNRSGDMAEMLARYETARKDQTIRLLNTQQLLDRQQIYRSRVIIGFSGLLILLIAALSFVMFSRSRIRRELHDVSLRNQLALDLHDDVGSSLSSIMLLSKMGAGKDAQGGDLNQRIIDKIDITSRDIMERMSDIVWSMNPKYDRFINLKEKIESHLAYVREVSEMNVEVQVADEIAGMKLPMELRKNLFLIVKEAVNNALKYSAASNIQIRIYRSSYQLCLTITDDGIGFDTAVPGNGNGMDTMMQRAAKSNGSYNISSVPGKGTTITVMARLPRIR